MADHLMTRLLQQSLDKGDCLNDPVTGSLIVRLLQRGIEQNEQILEEHGELKAAFASHTANEEALVRGLAKAFPKKADGTPDFEGHEAFHSTLIAESRARAAFYRELQHELVKKGLWGLFMILVALVSYWWSGQLRR